MDNSPGIYFLTIDHENILIIRASTDPDTDLPNSRFEAPAESVFTFEIHFPDHTFADSPITPDPEASIVPTLDESKTTLHLQVTPSPQATTEHEFHFKFQFDGINPDQGTDPTIVEKPPE
jgi:hypothetical protein